MSRREFQLVEGSSKKFWAIELSGQSHTVTYGRIGTAGQTQTKDFDSADAAKKSYEKQIAQKEKGGYVEVTAAAAKTAGSKQAAKGAAAVEVPAEAPEKAGPPPPAHTTVTRVIELDPEDNVWVTWREQKVLTKPEPAPFDFEACRDRLARIKKNSYGWVEWHHAEVAPTLSRREAHFWLLAMTANYELLSPRDVSQRIQEKEVTGEMEVAQAVKRIKNAKRFHPSAVMHPLFNLFDPPAVVELIQDEAIQGTHWQATAVVLSAFTRHVFPYLAPAEVKRLRESLRPHIDPKDWPTDFYKPPRMAFFVAALVGMPDEMLAVVRSIPDGHYAQTGWDHSYYHQTQRIVFGLGSPELVQSEMRRLKLVLHEPEFLRAWLALTEFAGLDYARDNILSETDRGKCERLLKEFTRVKAPDAAPHMMELKLQSKAPAVARQWLDEQVGNAITGIVPVAAGRGKLAEAAVEYLREVKKKGHEPIIRAAAKAAPPEVAESVRKNVLDFVEKEYPPLDAKSTPGDLKATFDAAAKASKGKLPGWLSRSALPLILVGEKRLSDEQAGLVLESLQRSTLQTRDPLVVALRSHADPAALDAFAWKLFLLWQGEGSPSKDKWAMASVGLFGGDVSALKITPLIRNWPGESQHARAVFGLDCLRAIGSDTALMQLNGISQKLKFKGLKQKAAEAMEAIAQEKGLTREQLEDRVVPDCDLDERGQRVFDFGPRQFRFVLGPDMKPMVKDADGKVKPDLPKSGAKDDAAKAAEAVAAWKLMKKQVKEVATIQAQRLEQAMVTGRRWPVADFQAMLVKHPLMINLVRLLLWGGYDPRGKLTATFRVTEDQTFADAKDAAFKLTGIDAVGVVHPLHLTEEQKSAWGEVFSDYEIVPPFPQLGRGIHRLEKDEAKAAELTRFEGVELPAPTLVFGLEKFGWVRGAGMDAGGFDEHSKPFPGSDVTAVVHYEGGVGYGYIDPNSSLTFKTCYFVKGIRGPSGYAWKEKTVRLGDVDPVAVSEVLSDLSALAAKGK
jgi:predicted DNA-binding WGR domain protein